MKILLKTFNLFRKIYWFICRPKTKGVRAIFLNEKQQILLVKHKYNYGWYLPGGGVKKNEDDSDAIKRELYEEIGAESFEIIKKLGEYLNFKEYKRDIISVFVVRQINQLIPKQNLEIQEISFFDIDNLPKEISPGTKKRIDEWLEKIHKNNIW